MAQQHQPEHAAEGGDEPPGSDDREGDRGHAPARGAGRRDDDGAADASRGKVGRRHDNGAADASRGEVDGDVRDDSCRRGADEEGGRDAEHGPPDQLTVNEYLPGQVRRGIEACEVRFNFARWVSSS